MLAAIVIHIVTAVLGGGVLAATAAHSAPGPVDRSDTAASVWTICARTSHQLDALPPPSDGSPRAYRAASVRLAVVLDATARPRSPAGGHG